MSGRDWADIVHEDPPLPGEAPEEYFARVGCEPIRYAPAPKPDGNGHDPTPPPDFDDRAPPPGEWDFGENTEPLKRPYILNGDISPLDFTTLQDKPKPERRWLVRDWVPWGRVTGLYGPGGEGKTLIAQQLMTAAALQKLWLGRHVAKVRSFGLLCEDDDEEAHLRQVAINQLYGCEFADLGDMRAWCRLGQDNVLMTFDNGRPVLTDFYHQFLERVKEFEAQLVVVDTGADTFAGNQNDAVQVRQFVQTCYGGIARAINGMVVANLHPSQAGQTSGSGESGSVQWQAAMRSRLYLTTPKAEDGDAPDPYIRTLTRKKANYAVRDETIPLRWKDGVFVNTDQAVGIIGSIERRTCERIFCDMVDQTAAENQPVSSNSHSGSNYAPKLFAKRPGRDRFTAKDFERAMQNLFAKGEIVNITYGRPSDPRYRIARKLNGNGKDSP